MADLWKLYGEWVTGLKSDIFKWARLKLTILYLLIVVFILVFYSISLFGSLTQHIRRNVYYRIDQTLDEEKRFADQTLDDTLALILVIDGVIFLVAAGLSYALAGYTLKPIRSALEAQTKFSADASHELRTPLAVMRTDIEVLLRAHQSLPPDARKVLQSNLEEIRSLSGMAEQLLTLSRGERLNQDKFANVNLEIVAKDSMAKFQQLAAQKKIKLFSESLEPATVRGSTADLARMFTNLLANAIAYTGERGSVSVSVVSDRNHVTVTIADTGVGIAAKDLPHIFERFYKVDTARIDSNAGSGLGLAIVKQIVDKHQGTIRIKSVVNQGTTVTLQFLLVSEPKQI